MSAVYPTALRDFLKADLDLDGDVRVQAVSSAYVYSAAHDFYNDVGGRLGTVQSLTGKTFTAGVFDAASVSYPDVALGQTITGLVFYLWTGVEATSRLIYFEDKNADTTPMSFPGNGAAIVIDWPNGYIFSI